MAFINTEKQLLAYKKKTEMQKELLPLSSVFSSKDKIEIDIIYRDLIKVCNRCLLNLPKQEK